MTYHEYLSDLYQNAYTYFYTYNLIFVFTLLFIMYNKYGIIFTLILLYTYTTSSIHEYYLYGIGCMLSTLLPRPKYKLLNIITIYDVYVHFKYSYVILCLLYINEYCITIYPDAISNLLIGGIVHEIFGTLNGLNCLYIKRVRKKTANS